MNKTKLYGKSCLGAAVCLQVQFISVQPPPVQPAHIWVFQQQEVQEEYKYCDKFVFLIFFPSEQ